MKEQKISINVKNVIWWSDLYNLKEYYYQNKFYFNNNSEEYYYEIYRFCKDECQRKYYYDTEDYNYIINCMNECIEDLERNKKSQKTLLSKKYYVENSTDFWDCSLRYQQLENCIEATLKIEENKIKINCTKCRENNNLTYHYDTNLIICRYIHYEKIVSLNIVKLVKKIIIISMKHNYQKIMSQTQ